MKSTAFLSLLLLVAGWVPCSAGPALSPHELKPLQLFTDHPPEAFRQLDQARQNIDLANINFDLLSAAVFHETNQRRAKEKLPSLGHDAKLCEAARMQAEIMANRGTISHVNPERENKKTPADRLRLAGLEPAFSAENVATSFGLAYTGGQLFFTREEQGKKVFSLESGGEPIRAHTYVSFAGALLDLWMESPPHRKNILSTKPQFLGASCRPGVNTMGMPVFFCAQVFYTPLKKTTPGP